VVRAGGSSCGLARGSRGSRGSHRSHRSRDDLFFDHNLIDLKKHMIRFFKQSLVEGLFGSRVVSFVMDLVLYRVDFVVSCGFSGSAKKHVTRFLKQSLVEGLFGSLFVGYSLGDRVSDVLQNSCCNILVTSS